MGKKRSLASELEVPDFIKMEIKDEIADSTILMARDRFRGALRELLHISDGGSSAESGDDNPSPVSKMPKKTDLVSRPKLTPIQPRKVKRRRPLQMDSAFHHTYVMKLFDRSVDLAQFEEDTPLYPICRAWIANQPRNPNLVPKARSPSPETNTDSVAVVNMRNLLDDNGEIQEVKSLPPPLPGNQALPQNRIPSPVFREKEELNLDYEGQTLKSKECLLKEHRSHWTAVRKKWHRQAHKNEERFAESASILDTIFKRAQSEFD